MAQTVEDTIKALKEFEQDLDRVKATVADAAKKMVKDARDWADSARAAALVEAKKSADLALERAKEEAAHEVHKIGEGSHESLQTLKQTMAAHKIAAAELVLKRLLGESP
jgi:vacuolar-type H+-ATPase subunit H